MTVTATLTAAPAFHDGSFPSSERLDTAQAARVAAFNARLADGDIAIEDVPCLCGGTSFALVAAFDRYRLRQQTVMCDTCGLVQSMPRLTAASYAEFYASDTYRALYDPELLALDDAGFERQLRGTRHRYDYIAAALARPVPGRVIEIGCGGGWNLEPFCRAGWTATGFDPGPSLVAFGRGKGLDLREGFLDDAVAFARENPADVIVLSHVLEHFPDPVAALTQLHDALAEGGTLYIEVPDGDAFCLGMLQNAHTYYFSRRTLAHYAATAGWTAPSVDDRHGHIGGMFRPSENAAAPGLTGEAARMRGIIRRHDRRESVKATLQRLGLAGMARGALRLARGGR